MHPEFARRMAGCRVESTEQSPPKSPFYARSQTADLQDQKRGAAMSAIGMLGRLRVGDGGVCGSPPTVISTPRG